MASAAQNTPVLLIIFNRPEKVQEVMATLEAAKPPRVYVAADGPRAHVSSDAANCAEARRIAQEVSWPCEVKTLFSDVNLRVDPAVEYAINWFFEHEESGIILEDDCIPHPDFFSFAGEMLERYRDDERVMMVSGNNFQERKSRGDESYYFARYATTWGWATWRRAWRAYDTTLSSLPAFMKARGIANVFFDTKEQRHWMRYFESLRNGTRTAWDAKWLYAVWSHDGLGIVPAVNLVTNIGFGAGATHTKAESRLEKPAQGLPPPYRAPAEISPATLADRHMFNTVYRVTLGAKMRYIFNILYEKARSGAHEASH